MQFRRTPRGFFYWRDEPPVLVSATFKFVLLSALFAEKCLFNSVYRHCKIFTRSLSRDAPVFSRGNPRLSRDKLHVARCEKRGVSAPWKYSASIGEYVPGRNCQFCGKIRSTWHEVEWYAIVWLTLCEFMSGKGIVACWEIGIT